MFPGQPRNPMISLPGSQWQNDLETTLELRNRTWERLLSHRYEAHVVTHDHESDSALYALDRKLKTIWYDRTGSKPSASTPTIYKIKNGKAPVVSNSQSHGCYAVDIERENRLGNWPGQS